MSYLPGRTRLATAGARATTAEFLGSQPKSDKRRGNLFAVLLFAALSFALLGLALLLRIDWADRLGSRAPSGA